MERLGPLIVLLGALGCTSVKHARDSVIDIAHKAEVATGLEPPDAAAQFACTWQRRLQQLPDPSRGGAMNTGVVGQAFLQTAKSLPAEVQGELTVIVSDASPSPAREHKPEVWHYTSETLKKLIVTDERFGPSIALFLPWPDDWTDVTRLTIQARYDQPQGFTIFAPQQTVLMDFSQSTHPALGAMPGKFGPPTSVPNPTASLQKMGSDQDQSSRPRGSPSFDKPLVTTKAWAGPAPGAAPEPAMPVVPTPPAGEFQRAVIPRR